MIRRIPTEDEARLARLRVVVDFLSTRTTTPGWLANLRRRLRQERDRTEAYVLRDAAEDQAERDDPFGYRGIRMSDFIPAFALR